LAKCRHGNHAVITAEAETLLDVIPQQYHLYLGIGGLVFLLLFSISAAQKFQAYQYERAAALRRMLWGIEKIEAALSKLNGSGISNELVVLFRKEILARYVTIRQIYSSFENINQLIEKAQQKIKAAESMAMSHRGNVSDIHTLNSYVFGITELIGYLHSQGHIAGMNEFQRIAFEAELGNLRADHIYHFHSAEAKQKAEQGRWDVARDSLKTIMRFFETHGPGNDHTSELYKMANEQYKQIMMKQVPGSKAEQLDDMGQAPQDAAASL
jgi:hypothetical protein